MAGSDSSSDSKVAVFRARQLLTDKRYADALQVCADELARGTNDMHLRLIAAHSLMAQGRQEGAKKEAQLVIRLDPGQAEAYRILVDICCSRGELATACEHLERILELEPDDAKSRALLKTLTNPSSLPLPEVNGQQDMASMQDELRSTSPERFIEDTGPVELLDEDLLEEDLEEEEAEDMLDDGHVDLFSGEEFKVTDSMMEELPSMPDPVLISSRDDSPPPGLKTELDASPKSGPPLPEKDASVEKDWNPQPDAPKPVDVGVGSAVKYQGTLRLPSLDELPDDEEAPTMPLLRPTAPPAPQLRLDPKAQKPVSHQRATDKEPAAPKRPVTQPVQKPDESNFEDFAVEPASIPLAHPEPRPIPSQTPDPIKARKAQQAKRPAQDRAPDPFDLMTGAAADDEPAPRQKRRDPSSASMPSVAEQPVEVSGNLMGLLTGGDVSEPSDASLPDPSMSSASPADGFPDEDDGFSGEYPDEYPEDPEVDFEQQLIEAGLSESSGGGERHTFRWFMVALIGLLLGGGGLGGYLWYRSMKYVEGEWSIVRKEIHRSTPEGYRQARKAAGRILKHRGKDAQASAALAMCDAALAIEFGDDKLKAARTALKKSSGSDSEWRTAAHAFLALADDPARAVGYLQKGLEVYPGSALLHYLRGRSLAGSGNPHKAIESYDKALKLAPGFVAAQIAQAVQKGREDGGYGGADAAFDAILKADADNIQALIERTRLRVRHNKDLDMAVSEIQKVTDDLKKKACTGQIAWAHLVKAQIYRLKGSYNTMSTELDEASKIPPKGNSTFLFELAGELMHLHRTADALTQMQGAIALIPKQKEYLHRISRVLLDLDDPVQAEKYIKAAPARDLETKLLTGRLAYASHKYSRAIDLLKRLLTEKSGHVEAAMYLALSNARKRRITDAITSLEKLAAKHPTNHRVLLAIASTTLWVGRLKQTHEALKKAWKITKLDPLAQTLSGHMSLRRHQVAKALKRYDRAIQTRPDYRPARVAVARLMVKMGKLSEARGQLKNISAQDRNKHDVHGARAEIELAAGNLDAARTSIAQAKSTGAPLFDLARLSGRLFLAQKKGRKALSSFERAIKAAGSRSAELLVLLGRAQSMARKVDDAYDTFYKALSVDGGYPEALLELGRIAIKDGEFNISVKRLNEALKRIPQRLRPDSMKATAYGVMGLAYLKKGDTGHAISNLQDAIDLDPKAAEPQFVMGQTYDRLDRPKRSVGYYLKALENDPTLTEAYERLGRAYAKLGDAASAAKYFREFLARNPPASRVKRVQQELQKLQGG